MKLQVIDLFAGGGGFTLGASQAGFSTALAVDNDADLSHSFPVNFPSCKVLTADISGADPKALLAHSGISASESFAILGGPPCQGFSSIGKRRIDDKRNSLVADFFRFVQILEPTLFLMENVPGILAKPFVQILSGAIDSVSSKYDFVGPLTLNAGDFGAATSRSRMIVIGYRPEYVDKVSESDVESLKTTRSTVYEAIHDLPSASDAKQDTHGILWGKYRRLPVRGVRGSYARIARQAPPRGLSSLWVREAHRMGLVTGLDLTNHKASVTKRFSAVGEGERESISRCPRLAWNKPSPTLRAGTGRDHGSHQAIRPLHPAEDRVINVREAARLQGFPDWFQFHPTKWHSFRMIGNSVSPIFATKLLALMRSRLHDENPPKG